VIADAVRRRGKTLDTRDWREVGGRDVAQGNVTIDIIELGCRQDQQDDHQTSRNQGKAKNLSTPSIHVIEMFTFLPKGLGSANSKVEMRETYVH
jgi:hypothetical protein